MLIIIASAIPVLAIAIIISVLNISFDMKFPFLIKDSTYTSAAFPPKSATKIEIQKYISGTFLSLYVIRHIVIIRPYVIKKMASGKQFNAFSLKLISALIDVIKRNVGENTAEMRAICIAEYLSEKQKMNRLRTITSMANTNPGATLGASMFICAATDITSAIASTFLCLSR